MSQIIPAIIPTSLEHLTATLEKVGLFTHDVQIDIVDGKFVPFISWPYNEGETSTLLELYTKEFSIEVDLMVLEPELVIESYLQAGVQSVVVHLESTNALEQIIALKSVWAFDLGFSIGNDTPISVLMDVIQYADYVQLMGIARIGSQGQAFDTRVISRIQELKALHPALRVSIDGSVNKETLTQLLVAGADRFVSGSAILHALDPALVFSQFSEIAKNHTV